MAPGRRRRLWLVCFVVLMFLLLADHGAVAVEPETTSEVVGSGRSMRADYLPATDVPEVGSYDNFQEFERRELVDAGYPSDPADPNCENDPTLCTP